ncbi:hypothetical protein CN501_08260 [Bacillus cereus]|uniref:hypothetical protein n=1 Tax=Bacillus cereus TaxID=1396 RepID=UPI000BF65C88|nr:hypothetical protein [Bacillus cereus]PES17524.1 hypothetical protein CN501_08260 [Bacillus cereus]
MKNFIDYKLTLTLNDDIHFMDADFNNNFKKLFLNDFESFEVDEESIIVSNEDYFIALTESVIIIHVDSINQTDPFPQLLIRIFDFLQTYEVDLFQKVKFGIINFIADYDRPMGSLLQTNQTDLDKLSDCLEKTVNAMGLKFSLDSKDNSWHYEIEYLPGEESNFILTMDSYHNDLIHLKDIPKTVVQQKDFLINKFLETVIKF